MRKYGIRTVAEAIDFLSIAVSSSENLNGGEVGARGVLRATLGNSEDRVRGRVQPQVGPIAFDTMLAYARGEEVPLRVDNVDRVFDASNAADYLPEAF